MLLDRGWHYATLFFGETQIRTGHLLVGGAQIARAAPRAASISRRSSRKINVDVLATEHRAIWAGSEEENLRPMDGSGLRAAGTPGARAGRRAEGHHARSIASRRTLRAKAEARRDGSDPRPRRGNPPDHRRADAPAAEQSDPHRRGRRRQDRRGRGLRAADRGRRRAAAAARRDGSARSTSA